MLRAPYCAKIGGMFLRWITAALFFCVLSAATHADDKAALQARLQRADALTRLDDAALRPWYLKASFQLYDYAGKPTEQGTLEEWWGGPGLNKRTITSPSYTATTILNKDGRFQSSGSQEAPYLLELLEKQIVHPLPGEADIAGSSPRLMKETAGGAVMDCIMLQRNMRYMPYPEVGIFPTYCFDHDKDMVHVDYDFGVFMAVRDRMGMFQQRVIPVDLTISMNRVSAVSAHMAMLKTMPLAGTDFVPDAGMAKLDVQRVQLGYSAIKDSQLENAAPVYPDAFHPSGHSEPVVVHAILGTDGHVHSLRLESTPDALLAAPAMAAVSRWSFRPYLLNGKPAEVETNLPVSFTVQGVMPGELTPHSRH